MKYSGIDLHSNNSVVSVLDEEDRVVAEKRLPNDLTKILEFLAPWQSELAGVVVESTFNWYWLVDGLQAAGCKVNLANTTAIKKYEGLKHSGDETDARYLAHLLRLGILPTGTILPPEHRAVRDLARKRMQLVRSRTTHILAVENITARQRGARISSNQVKRLTIEAIDQMALSPDVALAIKTNVAVIETLSAQIELLEKRLQEKVSECAEYGLLTSAPGIGKILATTILLETGPIEPLCRRWKLCLLRTLRGQCSHQQRQKERGREHQERQQVFVMGLRRSGELRITLLPRSKTLLRTKEGENEQRGGNQGIGAQTGAGMFPHSEGAKTI